MRLDRTFREQIAELDLTMSDFDYMSFSVIQIRRSKHRLSSMSLNVED